MMPALLIPILFAARATLADEVVHPSPNDQASSLADFVPDPSLGLGIEEAAVFDGKLWLRGTMGALVSYDLASAERDIVFAGSVRHLVRTADALWVLRSPTAGGPRPATDEPAGLQVSVLRDGKFQELPIVPASPNGFVVGLFVRAGAPIVVPYSLLSPDPDARTIPDAPIYGSLLSFDADTRTWREIALKSQIRFGQSASGSPVDGDYLYVGYDSGEWGGGLQAIDVATGEVIDIENYQSDDPCGGPLYSACDPVTEIIADPARSDCILASIGLEHFLSIGRVVRVCGMEVTPVFERPGSFEFQGRTIQYTEPIYRLAPAPPDGFWAASPDGLYHFSNGRTTPYESPAMEAFGGILLSRDLPGTIAVSIQADRIPLLIPIE